MDRPATGDFARGAPGSANPFIARLIVGGHCAALALTGAPSSTTQFGNRAYAFSARRSLA